MISERSRNFFVGVTLIAALVLAMYGVLVLGKFHGVAGIRSYTITLLTPNAGGVGAGSKVQVNGVAAGQVLSVDLQSQPLSPASAPSTSASAPSTSASSQATSVPATGPTALMARVLVQIDNSIDIPASATAVFEKQTIGTSLVSILIGAQEGPILPHDGTGVLSAKPADTGLIPNDVVNDIRDLKIDISALTRDLAIVAHDLHALLEYAPPEAVDNADPNDPHRPRENISTAVVRIDRTMRSLQSLLTDPKLQGQVRDAVQNIADASKQLKTTLENVDTTVKGAGGAVSAFTGAATQATATLVTTQREVENISQHLADTLAQIDKTVRQISQGDGTTGKLINDPRLYEGLNDLSRSLRTTVDDLDFLLKKWKDEGVDLRLK